MRLTKYLFVLVIAISSQLASAEVKNLDHVITKATPAELEDIDTLLQQISIVPIEQSRSGKYVYRVKKVEKNSLWDRAGIKVNDLVSAAFNQTFSE